MAFLSDTVFFEFNSTLSGVWRQAECFFCLPCNEVIFPDDCPPDKKILFEQPVIRCFIGDKDIVGVAFRHSSVGDTDKPGLFLHTGDRL